MRPERNQTVSGETSGMAHLHSKGSEVDTGRSQPNSHAFGDYLKCSTLLTKRTNWFRKPFHPEGNAGKGRKSLLSRAKENKGPTFSFRKHKLKA